MPELIQSGLDATRALRRAALANCLVIDRTDAFGCANLRSSQKSSPGLPMTSQDSRTGVTNVAPSNAPEFSGAFFLRTKLLPPRPAPEILVRPRLIERLQGNLSLPVTLVTANAGSG